METLIGSQLGAYQILEQIGRGGMATVYKAYQASMDRYVAIKVLPRHLSEDRSFVERFNREARILARLEHPHILPVHDYGEQNGLTYLVMRYVEAGTLKDLIAREGPPDLKEVARILEQVGGALDYAHGQGVLHRDIKPSNVLIDSRGDTFLTDFGIAKLVAETASFTASGAMIGTPAYMSPEQCQGEPVDARCDVYALGVLLYEMVTGQVPYEAETPLAVVLKHIHAPPPLPRTVRPDLPESVERVILKAMAKTPAERWPTPREMVEALNQAVGGLSGATGPTVPSAPGLAPTVIKRQVTPETAAAEGTPLEMPTASAAPVQPSAQAAAMTARRQPGETAALPAAASPPRAAGRLPRWLPIAGGAALLMAVIAVAIILLGHGAETGVLPGVTEPAVAAGTLAAASPVPTREAGGVAIATAAATALLPTSATAAPGPAGRVTGWTSYSNTNLALSLARQDTLLWVGSEGGLVRWDLRDGSYTKLGTADGLASGSIHDQLVDKDGVLWVATAAGLCRLDGENWITFDQTDGLDSDWVQALWEDPEGGVWAGTADGDRGLNYFGGEGWGAPAIPPLPVSGPSITALAGDSRTDLYVGMADAGLAHFDGQEWTLLSSKDGLPGDTVLALAVTDDALWAGFADGLVRFDRATGAWEKVRDIPVHDVYAASDGAVWFGTDAGALRFDAATSDWQRIEAATGSIPASEVVTDIAGDGDTIWFATYGAGALSYTGGDWKSWTTADWLGGNAIGAIRPGPGGSLWFTHLGTGLSRYEPADDAWQAFGQADGAFDWPSAPGVDSQGQVWIARDGAMASYDGRGWQARAVPELENVGVEAIDIGPGDVQWLRTDAGLMRHDPARGEWTVFGSADHPVLANVNALLISRDGTVWAGGQDGLVSYDGSAWSAVQAAGTELHDVNDLAEAADSSVWLVADGSLVHLAGGKASVYQPPNESYLQRLAIAPDGSVWVGSEGVGRFDSGSNRWQFFGTADGLIDMRVTDLFVTPDGTVWIGTEGGVSRYIQPEP
jgi:ligand-binding sensor domain-containing protein/tRNA A-37 threonylcarbamoyl transferase component Bud32